MAVYHLLPCSETIQTYWGLSARNYVPSSFSWYNPPHSPMLSCIITIPEKDFRTGWLAAWPPGQTVWLQSQMPCHILVGTLWTIYLIPLCLGFLFCKMGVMKNTNLIWSLWGSNALISFRRVFGTGLVYKEICLTPNKQYSWDYNQVFLTSKAMLFPLLHSVSLLRIPYVYCLKFLTSPH